MKMIGFRAILSLAVCASASCVAMSGCGSSGQATPRAVQVSLAAPVDGARIDAQSLLVFGTVTPNGARVSVAGHSVHVVDGAFRRWVPVHRGVTRIAIEATAAGFTGTTLSVAVRGAARPIAIPQSPRNALSEFLNRANQVCSQAVTKLNGFDFGHIDQGVTPAEAIQRAHLAASVGAKLLARLRAIHAPRKQAPGYAAFLASLQALDGQLNVAVATGASGQPTTALTLITNLNLTLSKLIQQGGSLDLFLCTTGLGQSQPQPQPRPQPQPGLP